jgi:hypothetical protein
MWFTCQYRTDINAITTAQAFLVSYYIFTEVKHMTGTKPTGKETATGNGRTVDIEYMVKDTLYFFNISLNA